MPLTTAFIAPPEGGANIFQPDVEQRQRLGRFVDIGWEYNNRIWHSRVVYCKATAAIEAKKMYILPTAAAAPFEVSQPTLEATLDALAPEIANTVAIGCACSAIPSGEFGWFFTSGYFLQDPSGSVAAYKTLYVSATIGGELTDDTSATLWRVPTAHYTESSGGTAIILGYAHSNMYALRQD